MKIYTYLFALLFIIIYQTEKIFTQPVFIATDIVPQVGDIATTHACTYTSPGANGAGVTWDFSGVSSSSTYTSTYINPAGTPFGSYFPSATVCSSAGGSYSYDFSDATQWAYLGWGSTVSGIVSTYSNTRKYFTFPISYGDIMNDTYYGDYVSGATTVTNDGTVQLKYIGYGTLITPTGTYTNVAKFRYVDNAVNSSITGGSTFSYTQDQTTFYWYKQGTKAPLYMMIDGVTVSSGTTYTYQYAYYLDATSVSSPEAMVTNKNISIFPNPTTDIVYIQNAENISSIYLYDLLGNIIPVNISTSQQGTQEIDLSTLSAGIYYIVCMSEEGPVSFPVHKVD